MTGRSSYCGIDVGTQGVRAVVVDDTGRLLGSGTQALRPGRRSAGRHEQQPADWWAALVVAVRAALKAAGDADVVAVALDATSGTLLLEDADGIACGPALMYDDARAVEEAARAARVGGPLWDELGYRLQPTWALPKALWILEHTAPRPGDRLAHQSDHLVRRLTGTAVATDTSHALKTGADLRNASWPADVFDALGLSVSLLPDLVIPGTVLGQVEPGAARATGLPTGTPVRAGMTDGCAAQIASGALRPGAWSSALGTTLVVKGSTRDLVRDPGGAVYCHRHPDGGWLPGGASSTGAGAIRDFLPGADLDALTGVVLERGPTGGRPGGVTYALAGTGERFPFVAPDAHGFLSDAVRDDADRFSALCHGIAYVERLSYDVLGVLGADVSGPVALTGGSTRNAWWNQLRTDVLGRPTTLPASAEAATGMAVLAAADPGALTETAERMVVLRERLEPDPARGDALRTAYTDLVSALADRGWLDGGLASAVLDRSAVPS